MAEKFWRLRQRRIDARATLRDHTAGLAALKVVARYAALDLG